MAGLLGWALSGCAPGAEDRSADADQAFANVDHVLSAQTVASAPGLPSNRAYATQLTVEDGLEEEALAELVAATLAIAGDTLLPSANAGVDLTYSDSAGLIDLRPAEEAFAQVQQINDVASEPRSGTLVLTQGGSR
ncbi:hypothetical protein [Demequina sp. NBRC 110051]|uniref:hypothetical protein n=1 Tax=Demequina sp. NBRC 110051 TaxID=1570340 RepID=UPI00117CFBD3|nr:hypothetical protein [Demequina sp. NBRC 110051]